ncbi:MAG: aminotransferase class III-fold pyridoxal phosphate-dependent enzyme [Proteobacteria bacterium]|nr:aminotransferase class III-fold pyridoxal phosphate-dependent enzyme [Pseudomonadota bacterium]
MASLTFLAAATVAAAASAGPLRARLALSRAKQPSLAGHARLARLVARCVPAYEYDDALFFGVDGAPGPVTDRRRAAFAALSATLHERHGRTMRLTAELTPALADLAFTSAYRVPFPFSHRVREALPAAVFADAADGVTLTDLDGQELYDVAGSYGVNLLGADRYKAFIRRAAARADGLGATLGFYHPVTLANVDDLCRISGLDAVSFHMSGTEAVMQAVRLARYHTGRRKLVRFAGAYHGWWGDVQPGIGNPDRARDTYTLRDMDAASLAVLARRHDIACVLVNPLQALHPNRGAPSDSALAAGGRRAGVDRAAYSAWLAQVRDVCTRRGIVLIVDEVFTGFRLARGGAQEYFGVRADMVTYGKTLGGGFPVGVVCGRAALMKRYRDDRPADICFARGTFNAHPYVMAAMREFLDWHASDEADAAYAALDATWAQRAEQLNVRLADEALPVRVSALSTIWTVDYCAPSRYHWMFQYYLRAAGLALSWVGSGRLVFSLAYDDASFAAVADRFVAAARAMRDGGWWWHAPGATDRGDRRAILREMIAARFGQARARR